MKFGKILLNNKIKKQDKIKKIEDLAFILDVMLNDINNTSLNDVQKWLDELWIVLEDKNEY